MFGIQLPNKRWLAQPACNSKPDVQDGSRWLYMIHPGTTLSVYKILRFDTEDAAKTYLATWTEMLSTVSAPNKNDIVRITKNFSLPYYYNYANSQPLEPRTCIIPKNTKMSLTTYNHIQRDWKVRFSNPTIVPLDLDSNIHLVKRHSNQFSRIKWTDNDLQAVCTRCGLKSKEVKVLHIMNNRLCAICFNDLSAEGLKAYNSITPEFMDTYGKLSVLQSLDIPRS